MNNTASTNAQQASHAVKERKEWTKPVLDILDLENAEHGPKRIVGDHFATHLSS